MEEVHTVSWKVVKSRSVKWRESLTWEEKAGCRKVGAPENTVLHHNMQLAYWEQFEYLRGDLSFTEAGFILVAEGDKILLPQEQQRSFKNLLCALWYLRNLFNLFPSWQ